MYKNVLQSIDNIQVWPVISFIIFFLFFLCLLWWVFTADREYIRSMENLPVEESEKTNLQSQPIKSQQP